jgi:HSP20 family molecular chaperone IbpA
MVYSVYTYALPFERNSVKFNRSFQEVKGLQIVGNEDGSGTVIANALGVSPEDIEISWRYGETHNSTIFTIKGETKIDGLEKPYNFEYSFTAFSPVKKIQKKFVNGLVILNVTFDKPSQSEIEVEEV